MRTQDSYGNQVVMLDNGLTYSWTKKTPLTVGERVRIPGNWAFGPSQGTVTQLGSEYDGYLVPLASRVLS